jgi:hypothetical protein
MIFFSSDVIDPPLVLTKLSLPTKTAPTQVTNFSGLSVLAVTGRQLTPLTKCKYLKRDLEERTSCYTT